MQTLSELVDRIKDLSHTEIIAHLSRAGGGAEQAGRTSDSRARRTRRGTAKDKLLLQSAEAWARKASIGRILHCLYGNIYADGETAEEKELINLLIGKLRAKGQWPAA